MNAPTLQDSLQTLKQDELARVKLVLERGVKIPPQPRILEELRKLAKRKEMDVRIWARVIHQDPGITALLFKVVSSPAYRQHPPLTTVEAILHAIGTQETLHLVKAIALSSLAKLEKNRLAYESFWARSHGIAQIAMLVADERVAVCNIFPDQAYLAGVFHDCGVVLLMQRFPTYCREMCLAQPDIWVDIVEEDRKFNAEHAVVGYLVARHWRLPDFITDAIRYHHVIGEIGQHEARSMVAILQLAAEIYSRDRLIPNPEWPAFKDDVLIELGLTDESLPEFVDIVLERHHHSHA